MPLTIPAWLQRAGDAIRQLADRPWTLFVLLLAINAIARPCSITSHDARLYSLQALNSADAGSFADDVFLRYGSQDQYSLFSRLVGPFVATFGLRLAFFVLYVTFNALFLFGVFRLVRALIEDQLVSTLALAYLVSAPLSYGGFDIFTVHEQFFTPRIVGTAFTLLALERIVRRHFVQAVALLLVGASVHPLMAAGGFLIWAGCVASHYLPTRMFIGVTIASLLAGVAILAIPSVGTAVFGAMDDDWHHLIRIAVGYNYPDTWQVKDWINLGLTLAVPVAAIFSLDLGSDRQRFVAIACLAGVVGFLATLAASFLPYALLFQAQPYRVLWIMKIIQVPLGFWLVVRWSQSTSLWPKIGSLALVASFCVLHYLTPELVIIGGAVAISTILAKLAAQPDAPVRGARLERAEAPTTERHVPNVPHRMADWWWYGSARGFVIGSLGWMAFRWWFMIAQRDVFAARYDLTEWLLFDLVSPMLWFAGLLGVAHFAPHLLTGVREESETCAPIDRTLTFPALRCAGLCIALIVPTLSFGFDASAPMRVSHTRYGADMAFVREFVHSRHEHPTIYASLGRPDLLWIDVGANSYFDIIQTAGVMFNRKTAVEIQRRAELVAKFEMAHQRSGIPIDDVRKVGLENLFKIPFQSAAPTQDDLVALCSEPGLDYVVIRQEFAGLYSASNGRVFVYECSKVKGLTSSARVVSGER
jgi:hypothetical protein